MLACIWLPLGESADDPAEDNLVRRLFAVSPRLEQSGELVFLDDHGLQRLHGGPAGLFAAIRRALHPQLPRGLALAADRFTAEVAARCLRRAVCVHAGEEALFLSRLPLAALPLSESLRRRLTPLGLSVLGDFASLPLAAVERRFGAEGVAMHRLARGEDRRGLLPQRERIAPVLHERFEEPVARLDELLSALSAVLVRLLAALAEPGHGVLALQLRLDLDDALAEDAPAESRAPRQWSGTLQLSVPETRVPLLVSLLRSRLEAAPPGAAVRHLQLRLLRSGRCDSHQNSLFGEVARDAARRDEALTRLAALFGPEAVARPVARPDHRLEQRWRPAAPDEAAPRAVASSRAAPGRVASGELASPAGSPRAASQTPGAPERSPAGAERAVALRLLPQPEELVAVQAGGTLVAFRRGRALLELARFSGPRRLTGGWWHKPWARDEYELLTAQGGRYRIARDTLAGRWLLLAEAD